MKCNETLSKIIEITKKRTGIDFFLYRCNTLIRRIRHRYITLQMSDENEYFDYFMKNIDKETQILKELFLINTTQFFRTPLHFAYLYTVLNRETKLRKKYVKVLNIGCSTGEETYSIAITLNELALKNQNLDYQIDAIDIDKKAIETAKKGIYHKDNLYNTPLWAFEKYFEKVDNGFFRLKKELIQNNINFYNSDILNYPFKIHGIFKYNVVFCENLLIYLKEYARKRVFEIIVKFMEKDGLLFISESEEIEEEFKPYFKNIAAHAKIFRFLGWKDEGKT